MGDSDTDGIRSHGSSIAGTQFDSLSEENDYLRTTLTALTDGVIRTNINGLIEYMNPVAEVLTGWSLAEAKGQPYVSVFLIQEHSSELNRVDSSSQSIDLSAAVSHGVYLQRRDGSGVFIENRVSSVFSSTGQRIGMVLVFHDISEAHKRSKQLAFKACHDELTKLPNRQLFFERVDQAISRYQRHQRPFAILFLDLDGFKQINDTLGHEQGDMLLKIVAERLGTCVRSTDTVARLGGDEFTILLTHLRTAADAVRATEQIREALAAPIVLEQDEMFVTASIGISMYPNDGGEVGVLLNHADTAMYQAKAMPPGNYQFFTVDLNASVQKKLSLSSSLRSALENESFHLFYQPEFNCLTKKVGGIEALIRWDHEKYGSIPAIDLIALAEELGLMAPLGEWILRSACLQQQRWKLTGLDCPQLVVNIAMRQFEQRDFVKKLLGILDEVGLAYKDLVIDVPEKLIIHNNERVTSSIGALHEAGVVIALDDFGKSFSSLQHLAQLPLDIIKIAPHFIHNLSNDNTMLVQAIIHMGHDLGCDIVAEAVENKIQEEVLVKLGCPNIQGYHICEPLDPDELSKWLTSQRA